MEFAMTVDVCHTQSLERGIWVGLAELGALAELVNFADLTYSALGELAPVAFPVHVICPGWVDGGSTPSEESA